MVRRAAILAATGLGLLLCAGTARAAAPASCGLPAPDQTFTGSFSSSQQGAFVFVPFNVTAGTTQVRVAYCYDQPPGPATPGSGHTLDLGVYQPRVAGVTRPWGPPEFRGWGGSGYKDVTITPQGFPNDAQYTADKRSYTPGLTTRSFKPGSIPTGQWAVELGLANIAAPPADPDGVAWRVEVQLYNDPSFDDNPYSAPAHDPTPVRTGAGWYAGDFHVHAEHSGDADATLTETGNYAFGTAGLDFIALTDHNTGTGWPEYDRRRSDHPNDLLMRSEEVTTYHGHTNNQASGVQPDYRTGALYERQPGGSLTQVRAAQPVSQVFDAVHAGGGFTEVNHPTIFPAPPFPSGLCRGCQWTHRDAQTNYSKVDAIEVATGTPNSPFTPSAIQFWEDKLAQGHHIAALGGSDSHSAGRAPDPTDSPVGTPTTMVYASELSEPGLVRGVKAGHTYVKVTGPSAPDLRLEARRRGVGGPPAIFGDSVGSNAPVDFTARVTGGSGANQLQIVKNGVPISVRPVTGSSYTTTFSSNGPGRYRLQLMKGTQVVDVSSPVYVSGQAGAPPGNSSGGQGGGSGSRSAGAGAKLRAGFGRYGPSRVRRGRFLMRCRVSGRGRRVCRVRALARVRGHLRTVAFGRAALRGRSVLVRLRLNRRGRHLLALRPRGLRVRLALRAADSHRHQAFAVKRAVLRNLG